jgi:hypothetical protein
VVVELVNGAAVALMDGMGRPVPTETMEVMMAGISVELTLTNGPEGIVTLTFRTAPGAPVTVKGSSVSDAAASMVDVVDAVALTGATRVSLAGGVRVTLMRTPLGVPVTRIGIWVNDAVGVTVVILAVGAVRLTRTAGTPVTRTGKGRISAETVVVLGYSGLARSVGRTSEPVPVARRTPVPVIKGIPVPSGRAVSIGTTGTAAVPVPMKIPVPGMAVGLPYVPLAQIGLASTGMGRPAEAETAVPVVRRSTGVTVSVTTMVVAMLTVSVLVALTIISVKLASVGRAMPVPSGIVEFTGEGMPVTRGIVTLNSPVMIAAVGRMLSDAVPFKTGKGAEIARADVVAAGLVAVRKMGVGTVALIMDVRSPTGKMEKMISLSGTPVVKGMLGRTISRVVVAGAAETVTSAEAVTVTVTSAGSSPSPSLGPNRRVKKSLNTSHPVRWLSPSLTSSKKFSGFSAAALAAA